MVFLVNVDVSWSGGGIPNRKMRRIPFFVLSETSPIRFSFFAGFFLPTSMLASTTAHRALCLTFIPNLSTTFCQFHQRFTCTFFVQNFGAKKISSPKLSFVIFGPKILYEKFTHKMLMKLTTFVNFINI